MITSGSPISLAAVIMTQPVCIRNPGQQLGFTTTKVTEFDPTCKRENWET